VSFVMTTIKAKERRSALGWLQSPGLAADPRCDLEYDPDDWPRLLDPILKARLEWSMAARFTGERMNMAPLHWFGNRLLSLVTNILYSSTLSDMETCYKLLTLKFLRHHHRVESL